jgi:hypothetical protein
LLLYLQQHQDDHFWSRVSWLNDGIHCQYEIIVKKSM